MNYGMKNFRKEDISLYLYVKDVVLRDFHEREENAPLKLLSEICGVDSFVYEIVTDFKPSPMDRGRGLVYFDIDENVRNCEPYTTYSGLNGDGKVAIGTPEQSNMIKVYETFNGELVEVNWLEYMIDYIDGRIISTRKINNPVCSYVWNHISVVDEWAAVEAAEPPVVVVDVGGVDKEGYQLGGGKKVKRKVEIHIFASNTAERNDIVETLYDGFYNRSTSIYDFPTGAVLDYDGTFYGRRDLIDRLGYVDNKLTYLFDRRLINGLSKMHFEEVSARHVNLPLVMTRGKDEVMLSDLNAYRSKVTFDMISYDNSVIMNIF